jgi:enoyl-CoA hydratase/carnithine racemase/ketosteroid isomerase-like protein
LVRSILAAWESGDYSSVEWAHPEVEFVFADGPAPGSWTGLDGLAEGFRSFLSAWEEFRTEADDYVELDNERVLVLAHYSGRGKGSGLELAEMRAKGAHLFHVHGGKVTRFVSYWHRERALTDLGLAPENGARDMDKHAGSVAEANVEPVRRLLRAFSEGNFELGLRDVDAGVVGRYADPFSGPVTFEGRDEVKAWWERIHHGWDQLDVQIEEVLEARAGLVVLATRFKVRGKSSGAEVEGEDQFQVWRLREGKIVSFEFFDEKEQALEAARLPARGSGPVSVTEKQPTRRTRPSGDVTVEIADDFVATVEIHRPPDNHIDAGLVSALADAYEALERDPTCRAIVLCSEGKHFCAGAAFGQPGKDSSSEQLRAGDVYREAVRLFAAATPVVAAVQGAAVGGGLGLALSADFRVASPESRFWANFARLGFHHGFGMTVTLPALVGQQAALELLYTGRRVRGDEAHSLGLCDRLVPSGRIRTETHALAADIAASAPVAVLSIRQTLRGDLAERVHRATEREQAEQHRLMQTEDFLEGLRAASERRDPRFGGH